MRNTVLGMLRQNSAATAIEYAFVAGLTSIVIFAVLGRIGGSLGDVFAALATRL